MCKLTFNYAAAPGVSSRLQTDFELNVNDKFKSVCALLNKDNSEVIVSWKSNNKLRALLPISPEILAILKLNNIPQEVEFPINPMLLHDYAFATIDLGKPHYEKIKTTLITGEGYKLINNPLGTAGKIAIVRAITLADDQPDNGLIRTNVYFDEQDEK